jgi:hypothetical protein
VSEPRDLTNLVPNDVRAELAVAVAVLEQHGPAVTEALRQLDQATTAARTALDPAQPTEDEWRPVERATGINRGWDAAYRDRVALGRNARGPGSALSTATRAMDGGTPRPPDPPRGRGVRLIAAHASPCRLHSFRDVDGRCVRGAGQSLRCTTRVTRHRPG